MKIDLTITKDNRGQYIVPRVIVTSDSKNKDSNHLPVGSRLYDIRLFLKIRKRIMSHNFITNLVSHIK